MKQVRIFEKQLVKDVKNLVAAKCTNVHTGKTLSLYNEYVKKVVDMRAPLDSEQLTDLMVNFSVSSGMTLADIIFGPQTGKCYGTVKETCRHLAVTKRTIFAWSLQKNLYSFDPDLALVLLNNRGKIDDIPPDILSRLPDFGVAVSNEIPIINFNGQLLRNFLVSYVDHKLHINIAYEDQNFPYDYHNFCCDLKHESIKEVLQQLEKSANQSNTELLKGILPFILYLCSDNFRSEMEPNISTSVKSPKKNLTFVPPSNVRIKQIGKNDGDIIRAFNKRDKEYDTEVKLTGRTVKPHIRKGHWHSFWKNVGTERILTTKFLLPIFVNMNKEEVKV